MILYVTLSPSGSVATSVPTAVVFSSTSKVSLDENTGALSPTVDVSIEFESVSPNTDASEADKPWTTDTVEGLVGEYPIKLDPPLGPIFTISRLGKSSEEPKVKVPLYSFACFKITIPKAGFVK